MTSTQSGTVGYRDNSWQITDLVQQAAGFHVLSDTLAELTEAGHPIVVGTADLKYSNGLVRYQELHPDRFIQYGISEQNMVSAAAGMAAAGLKPYVATFASFMSLLCVEQIRTDTAYTKLPVRLIGHHSGFLLGFYGTSHHATEDLAIMRSIANMTVIAPADANQFAALLRATVDIEGPVYFRVGRGRDPQVYSEAQTEKIEVGRAIHHYSGKDLTIIATGSMVYPSLGAVTELRARGLDVGFVDMHTIKPFDEECVRKVASESRVVLTIEEHNVIGGLGGAVAEVMSADASTARLVRHGVNDVYAPVGPPTHLYRHFGLDTDGIILKVEAILS